MMETPAMIAPVEMVAKKTRTAAAVIVVVGTTKTGEQLMAMIEMELPAITTTKTPHTFANIQYQFHSSFTFNKTHKDKLSCQTSKSYNRTVQLIIDSNL